MQISFCELRAKEVVNVYNGKRLGNIIDLIFETSSARVLGIVVPNSCAKFSIFKPSSDIFIPYCNIVKIGKDVILVDLSHVETQEYTKNKNRKDKRNYKEDNITQDDDNDYIKPLQHNNHEKSNDFNHDT